MSNLLHKSTPVDINMTVAPSADPLLNLTPQARSRCCDLLRCCLPPKGESNKGEDQGMRVLRVLRVLILCLIRECFDCTSTLLRYYGIQIFTVYWSTVRRMEGKIHHVHLQIAIICSINVLHVKAIVGNTALDYIMFSMIFVDPRH